VSLRPAMRERETKTAASRLMYFTDEPIEFS